MNAAWLVQQLRTAAHTLHENGEYTADVALETLAEEIETKSARLREAQYAGAGWTPPEES